MGVIIIDGNGNEVENTYKKKDQPIVREDYIPSEPELEIVQIRREEPRRMPYVPLITPEKDEKPLVDGDFDVVIYKKKIPSC